MFPIKKLFGRKSSENRKSSDDVDEVNENLTRLSRRHSSGRASVSSAEGFQDPTTTKMSTRRSFFFGKSRFKRRNSTCSYHSCSCTTPDVKSTTGSLSPPVDAGLVPDQNGNAVGNKDGGCGTIKMNGTSNHISAAVCDDQLDPSPRGSPKLSLIERKIWNQKRNTSSVDVDRWGSVRTDAVNHRNGGHLQSVPDGEPVGSPRMYVKGPSAATLFNRIERCASSSSGHPRASTGAFNKYNGFPNQFPAISSPSSGAAISSSGPSGTSIGVQNIDPNVDSTTRLENSPTSADGCFSCQRDVCVTSGDIQCAASLVDESDSLENPDSTSTGISRSFVGISNQIPDIPAFSRGISATTKSESDDTYPVPPPRKNRTRGRLSFAGDLSRFHAGQTCSRSAKCRSLSELLLSGSGGSGSTDDVNLSMEQSRSSTLTSGILSDVTPPSSTSSSPCTLNADQYEQCSCSVSSLLPVSLVETAMAVATSNSDQFEPIPSVVISTPSSSASVSWRSSSSALALSSEKGEHVLFSANSPPPSSILSPSPPSDRVEGSSESRCVDGRLLLVFSDPDRSGKPSFAHPLRALRYSSNVVADCIRCGPESGWTSPALVRRTGLTLDHVMTPPRITVATERHAAVADHFSPDVDVAKTAEISQLADDVSHTDNNLSVVDHETNNERLVGIHVVSNNTTI